MNLSKLDMIITRFRWCVVSRPAVAAIIIAGCITLPAAPATADPDSQNPPVTTDLETHTGATAPSTSCLNALPSTVVLGASTHIHQKPISPATAERQALIVLCGSVERPAAQAGTLAASISPSTIPDSAAAPILTAVPVDQASKEDLWDSNVASYFAFLLIIGAAFCLSSALFLRNGAEQLSFRRYWGGFGGASTGWELSPSLTRLLVAIALSVLATILFLGVLQHRPSPTESGPQSKPTKSTAHSASAPSIASIAHSAGV